MSNKEQNKKQKSEKQSFGLFKKQGTNNEKIEWTVNTLYIFS